MSTNQLSQIYNKTMNEGEQAWKANRNAVKKFDIFQDAQGGLKELFSLLQGLEKSISNMEELRDVAREAARYRLTTLR